LVTGASSGIGLETALELARRGWRVWAGVRTTEAADRVRATAREQGTDDRLRCVDLEVRDTARVRAAVREMLDVEQRGPDLVVANAGVGALGFVETMDEQAWREALDINLLGVIRTVRETLPAMRNGGGGHLVLVSSNAANFPHPAFSAYAASKWGLEGMAEALALEVAPFGVKVTIVQPGAVRSGFGARILASDGGHGDYAPALERMAPAWAWLERHAVSSAAVAAAMADAVERPRPPLRLRIGHDARAAAVLRHLMPGSLRREIFRRFYRVPSRATSAPVEREKADTQPPHRTPQTVGGEERLTT